MDKWEGIVNEVAKMEVGENMTVCGRAVRWWDSEKIKCRRELHKRMIHGQGDLWGKYCRLRKERI